LAKAALSLAAEAEGVTLQCSRLPFILRPERTGQHKWIEVLRLLGISRGNPGWADDFIPSLAARGESLGLQMNFEGDVGNSIDSLRLLAWAGCCNQDAGGDLQEALAVELGMGQFTRAQCVGDHAVLVAAATAVGLPTEEASAVLADGDRFKKEVESKMLALQRAGIHSIPVFLFKQPLPRATMLADGADVGKERGRIAVNGARSVDEYREILRDLSASAASV
jgi:predicted DsbA family dithiol-disulfide isomerase